MENPRPFRILALDGGGTRGIYTAHLLSKIEETFAVRIRTCFDLIVGTSTGSIIAGAAATDIPMPEIVDLFESEAPYIFRKRWYRTPMFFSKYPKKRLAGAIAAHIPATPLREIPTPLMLTSSDLTKTDVHVFRSSYAEKLGVPCQSDTSVNLREAILASCAAPTFFAPASVGGLLLADGALWANNPSTIAFAEAVSVFGRTAPDIRMLSIGTGHCVNMYRQKRNWGFITGWGGPKLTSHVTMLQSQASAHITNRLLQENYLRLDPEIDFWGIDKVEHLDTLKSIAGRDFEARVAEIEGFVL